MRPAFAVPLVVALIGGTAYFAFLPDRSGTVAFWLLAGGPSVVLALVALAWGRREELLRDWLRPKSGDFTIGLVGAVLLFGVAWGFTKIVTPVGSPRAIWLVSLYGQIGDPRVLQAHAAAVFVGIWIAAFAEEVLWRGAVTQLLAQQVGSRSAWVWAAALYALAYVPTAWSLRSGGESGLALDPVLPIAALGASLLWGGMARAFGGRLVPSVLAHALFDWAVLMMFPLWSVR